MAVQMFPLIAAAGFLLVIGLLSVTTVCLRMAGPIWPVRRAEWGAWALLVILISLLWLRPEEGMEAGEDPASYLWAAHAFHQHNALRFEDPGLTTVPESERALFRYGHAGFLNTKDAVLWANDDSFHAVRPHFFPLYSVLLATPLALGWEYGLFLVTPLIALGCGLMLVVLAYWLTGRRYAGWVAMAVYAFNPVIVWNARALRAEWPATLLVMAGLLLWLNHVWRRDQSSGRIGLVTGLAFAASMWFHVTAAYVVLPVLIVSGWKTRLTSFWTGWWCGIVGGMFVFFAQLVWITDPYWILDNLLAGVRGQLALGTLIAGTLALVGLRYAWPAITRERDLPVGWVGIAMGIAYSSLALLTLQLRGESGRLPGFPEWTSAYISVTDFDAVSHVMASTAVVFALVGVPLLCGRRGTGGSLGRWLFLLLAPASMTIGWTLNFMFESRRMILALVPLLVLSSTHLAWWLGTCSAGIFERMFRNQIRFSRHVAVAVTLIVAGSFIAVGVRGRSRLYTTWNYRGLYSFYSELSREVEEMGDFILGEYTQTTVPLERLSRRPALPLAWGYRSEDEYRRAEQVWAALVHDRPDAEFLLVTPFSGGIVPGLTLELIMSRTLQTERLGRARGRVPDGPHTFLRTLHVHRVRSADETESPLPYTRIMDGGQLGLSGYANRMPSRTIEMAGIFLPPLQPASVTQLLPDFPGADRLHLLAYSLDPLDHLLQVRAEAEKASFTADVHRLHADWYLIEWRHATPQWTLETSHPLALAAAFAIADDGDIQRLEMQGAPVEIRAPQSDLQWLRAQSRVALPGGTSRLLYMLAWAGHPDNTPASLMIRLNDPLRDSALVSVIPGWAWYGISLPASAGGAQWVNLTIDPPWDPNLSSFPDDLGLMIHMLHIR